MPLSTPVTCECAYGQEWHFFDSLSDREKDIAVLEDELRSAEAEIDAAYWRFTRMARAKPPSMVCPNAYDRRTAIKAELRQRQRARGTWKAREETDPPNSDPKYARAAYARVPERESEAIPSGSGGFP